MPFTAQKEIFKQLEEYADSHRLTYPIGTRRNWCSAMGGCVATARRHSLLCLPRLL